MPELEERLMWYGITLVTIGLAALLTPQIVGIQRFVGWASLIVGVCTLGYLERTGVGSLLHSTYSTFGIPYPNLSLIVVALFGAILFGGGWWILSQNPTSTASSTPVKGPTPTVSASWTLIKPGHFPPGDFRNVPIATFVTEGASDRLIGTNGPFKALRFMKPTEKTVHAEDLPATITYQAGYLVVKRFTDKGFTVDENGAKGVEIEAEVYH